MEIPRYSCKPIHGIRSLALALGESEALLRRIAQKADRMYRYVPQLKKNGEPRHTWDAHEPLKTVQRKIVDRILSRVEYPSYLHGGIKDKNAPRSIFSNAAVHAGAKHIVLQDIADFYPSISVQHVYRIFRGVFGFGHEVAVLLASLTTLAGNVPQGASTSSYLANLVFWDIEPAIVEKLSKQGYRYSRFADDITISTMQPQNALQAGALISTVTGMLASKGCFQKRSKMHVRKRGQTIPAEPGRFAPLTVTGLSVFNAAASLSKAERKKIRAAVKQIETLAASKAPWAALDPLYRTAMGRIGQLIACKHPDGERFKARLNAVKKSFEIPLLDRYAAERSAGE